GAGSGAAAGNRNERHTNGASGVRAGGAAAGAHGAPLPDAVLRSSRSQGSSGNGSLFALVGGGLAILVVGAFGGTVLRHSRRPTPSGRPHARDALSDHPRRGAHRLGPE